MAVPPTSQELTRLLDAFTEGGGERVIWKEEAARYICGLGVLEKQANILIRDYISNGGKVKKVVETRTNFTNKDRFHFDATFAVCGTTVYFEMLLRETEHREPLSVVVVASAHRP